MSRHPAHRPPRRAVLPLDPERERALCARLVAGDERALAELMAVAAPGLRGPVVSLLGDPDEAEDVMMEAFMLLWTRIEVLGTRSGGFGPWLMRVARNRGIDRLRARQRRRKLNTQVGAIAVPSGIWPVATEPDEAGWAFWPLREHLDAALAALPDGQQAVVRLAYFDGLSQTEIARRLDVPLGTVKTRLWRALVRLRASLTKAPARPRIRRRPVGGCGREITPGEKLRIEAPVATPYPEDLGSSRSSLERRYSSREHPDREAGPPQMNFSFTLSK